MQQITAGDLLRFDKNQLKQWRVAEPAEDGIYIYRVIEVESAGPCGVRLWIDTGKSVWSVTFDKNKELVLGE